MKLLQFFTTAAILVIAASFPNAEWEIFKQKFAKKYETVMEEKNRLTIFLSNKAMIDSHNKKYEKGAKTFTMEINKFADMTSEEIASRMNGYYQRRSPRKLMGKPFIASVNVTLPTSIDWREKGYVTEVKDQGQCGSCWSFSATGSLEGQNFAKTGKLVSLSEQNLIDCSSIFGNAGCNGGWMDYAFAYVKFNKGIDTEAYYPYEETDSFCRYSAAHIGGTCSGHTDLPTGDEDALKEAVGTIGPISVAIDASRASFQLYSRGVYYEAECSSSQLDHGVLAVGYGTEDNMDYWIVKNSWGSSWGDAGYIKMARNRNNNCGIATAASYPHV